MRIGRALTRLAFTLGFSSLAASSACSGGEDPSPTDAALLRTRFPQQAARVLTPGEGFVTTAGGFAPAGTARAFAVELPRGAEGTVRFHLPAVEIAVREAGIAGEGEIAEDAVAYRRAGGTSYWTAVPNGVEEWLHLAASAVRRGEAVAAWDVEGAAVRQDGDVVSLVDAAGRAALTVSAPAAFAAGGRPAAARIEARGARIEVFVDADGEDVLVDPMWVQTGSLSIGRTRHAAALLANGKVLVCGGAAVNNCELYDHGGGTFTSSGNLTYRRQDLTETTLPGGKVLIAGGALGNSQPVQAEIYDPMSGMITVTGSMSTARANHTATLLPNGRVLIAGGLPPGTVGTAMASCEVYYPATGSFMNTGSMSIPRAMHTATLLADGRVLVAGGNTLSGVTLVATGAAEIYDPGTGLWTPVAPMNAARQYHTATLLPNGQVLVAGGKDATVLGSAEIFDPIGGGWTTTGSLAYARWEHMAVALGNGTVLVAGGGGTTPPLPSNVSEIFDPGTGSWLFAGSLVTGHVLGTMTVMNDGTALLAGGQTFIAETFNTQSVNGTTCAVGGECKSGNCAGGVCCDAACNDDCHACKASKGAVADGTCTPLSGTPCNDGDACSIGDTCSAGVCNAGTPKQCVAADFCHLPGICDPLTGMCSTPKKPEGTPCEDGDLCTQGDFCSGGECQSGPPVVCTAPDTCHFAGTCNPNTGQCFHPVKSDGESCDDGDGCTQTDSCLAGACIGSDPVVCPAPTACESANTCEKATGTCKPTPKPDGTACNDNDVCTSGDACVAGACQPGKPVTCDAPDACHSPGACSPVTGSCVNPAKPDGSPCPGGACMNGACVEGADAGPTGTGGGGEGGSGGGGGGAGGGTSASSSSSSGTIHGNGAGGDGGDGGAAPGGCSCEAAGAGEAGGLGWLAVAAAGLVGVRRRRR